jgi:hypothetical protein
MAAKESQLFTAGKLAEQWGIPAGKVKKAIESLGIAPDHKKGACNYYSEATAGKIKKALG